MASPLVFAVIVHGVCNNGHSRSKSKDKRERNFDERLACLALIEGTWLLSFGGCVL